MKKIARGVLGFKKLAIMAFVLAIFFVATSVVQAQTQFVGPTAEPPGDNRPGYIFNVINDPDLGPQNASIDVSGTTVGGARVIGDELCIGDETNCIDGWDASAINDGDWFEQGTQIYTDASGVGIGTANPSQNVLLEVKDNSSPSKAVIRVSNVIGNPELQLSLGQMYWALYADHSDESLRFWSPSTDNAFILDADGNASVAGGLQVGNTRSTAAGTIRWTGSAFEGHNGLGWSPLGGGEGVSNYWVKNGNNVYYDLGRVGVKTQAPAADLHVNGSVFFKGGSGDVNGDGRVDNVDAVQIADYVAGNFSFTDAQKASADVNGDAEVDNDDATIMLAEFVGYERREIEAALHKAFNRGFATTPSLDGYLNVPGRAHIGSASARISSSGPTATLQVTGDILASNGITLGNSNLTKAGSLRWTGSAFEGYNGSSWAPLGAGSSSTLWQQNGSNIYYNSGNVGIGTNTPTRALSVIAPTSQLFELRNSATNDWMGIHLSGANTQIYSNDQIQYFSGNGTQAPWNGQHLFYGSNKVFMDQQGVVRQTLTADGRLIMTNANIEGVSNVTINDPGQNEGISWAGSAAKIYVAPLSGDLNQDGYLRLINDGGITFEPGTEGTQAMTITPTNRVGIGTQTPAFPLDVLTSESSAWAGRFYNTSNQARAYFAQGNGYGMYLYPGNNSNDNYYALRVQTPTGSGLDLRGDGDLGLGISYANPSAQLHVRNDNVANDLNTIIGEYDWTGSHGNQINIRNGVIGSGHLNFSASSINSSAPDNNVLAVIGTYGQAYSSGTPTNDAEAQLVLRGGNFTAYGSLGRSNDTYWLSRRHEGIAAAATGLADMNVGIYSVAGGGPGNNGLVNIGIYGKGDLGNCAGLTARDCRAMYDFPTSGDYAGYFDGDVKVRGKLSSLGNIELDNWQSEIRVNGGWGIEMGGTNRPDDHVRVGEIHDDAGLRTDTGTNMRFDAESGLFRWSNSSAIKMVLQDNKLAINTTNPGSYNLYVNGTGYANNWGSEGRDYAEWFEKEGDTVVGDLIGINLETGLVRKYQSGDKFIGIESDNPSIAGNSFASDEEMSKTHTLVGLLGQLPFNEDQVVIKNRLVFTLDGEEIGVLLHDGSVLIGL